MATYCSACFVTMLVRDETGVAQSSAVSWSFRAKIAFSISLRMANSLTSVWVLKEERPAPFKQKCVSHGVVFVLSTT